MLFAKTSRQYTGPNQRLPQEELTARDNDGCPAFIPEVKKAWIYNALPHPYS